MMGWILVVLTSVAHADLWGVSLGALLAEATVVEWLTVVEKGDAWDATRPWSLVRVTKVIRGAGTVGRQEQLILPDVDSGTRLIRACGYKNIEACFVGVESEGLVFFTLGSDPVIINGGSVQPAVSLSTHIEDLIVGRQPPNLCVKIGRVIAHVDPRTGVGRTQDGNPAGFTLTAYFLRHEGLVSWGQLQLYEPDGQPIYRPVGRPTYEGFEPRLSEGCLVLDPNAPPPGFSVNVRVWIPRGFEVVTEKGMERLLFSMEADPVVVRTNPGTFVGVHIRWMRVNADGTPTHVGDLLTDNLRIQMRRGPDIPLGQASARITVFETEQRPRKRWDPWGDSYRELWTGVIE